MAVFSGNGSNTAPSFTFSSDTNLGFYRAGADTLAATSNGNKMFEVGTTYAGVGTAAAPPLGYTRHLYVTAGTTGDERSALIMQGSRTTNNTVNTIDFYHKANLVSQIEVIRGGADDAGSINISTREGGGSLTNRATFTQNGYLRLTSGASGIQFGGATSANDALNDYEQGAFTVNYSTTGNPLSSVSYNASAGYYVKVGRLVHCWFDIRTSNVTFGSATGNLTITGIPFIPAYAAAQDAIGFGLCGNFTGVTSRMGIVVFYNTLVANVVTETVGNAATAFAPVAASALTTGAFVNQNHIEVQFSYITD